MACVQIKQSMFKSGSQVSIIKQLYFATKSITVWYFVESLGEMTVCYDNVWVRAEIQDFGTQTVKLVH